MTHAAEIERATEEMRIIRARLTTVETEALELWRRDPDAACRVLDGCAAELRTQNRQRAVPTVYQRRTGG